MAVRRLLTCCNMGALSRISSCEPKYFLGQSLDIPSTIKTNAEMLCHTGLSRAASNESDMAVIDADVPLAEDVRRSPESARWPARAVHY